MDEGRSQGSSLPLFLPTWSLEVFPSAGQLSTFFQLLLGDSASWDPVVPLPSFGFIGLGELNFPAVANFRFVMLLVGFKTYPSSI